MAAKCSQANTQPSDFFPAGWGTHVPAVPIAALEIVGPRNRISRMDTRYSRLILRSQLRSFWFFGRLLEPQIRNVSGDSKSARSTFLALAVMVPFPTSISGKTSWFKARFPRAMLVNARVLFSLGSQAVFKSICTRSRKSWTLMYKTELCWTDAGELKLRKLRIDPGKKTPRQLRAIVEHLKETRQQGSGKTVWDLYEKGIQVENEGLVKPSKGWIYDKVLPRVVDGELDWTYEDWAVTKLPSHPNPVRANEATRSEVLRTLVEEIWLPAADLIPGEMLNDGSGPRSLDLGGRSFFWIQESNEVVRCWITQYQEGWLRQEVFRYLSGDQGRRLEERYDELQREVTEYINRAARYDFRVGATSGDTPIWQVREYLSAPVVINWEIPEVKEALFLISAETRLKGQAEEFRKNLQLAVS